VRLAVARDALLGVWTRSCVCPACSRAVPLGGDSTSVLVDALGGVRLPDELPEVDDHLTSPSRPARVIDTERDRATTPVANESKISGPLSDAARKNAPATLATSSES
jgi:hypothetical protein